MKNSLEIEVMGVSGAGKTTVLHIIGKALTDAGFNVAATDDTGTFTEFSPVMVSRPDDRLVSIVSILSSQNEINEAQGHRPKTENEKALFPVASILLVRPAWA